MSNYCIAQLVFFALRSDALSCKLKAENESLHHVKRKSSRAVDRLRNTQEEKNNFQVRSINERQIFCLPVNYVTSLKPLWPIVGKFQPPVE